MSIAYVRYIMNIEPVEWNVVIVGAWNTSILTPKFIYSYLFNQKTPAKLNIGVPIDTDAPYRVTHRGVVVMSHPDRLVIQAESPNFKRLQQAMIAGRRAIQKLPITPYIGAGINLKFSATGLRERALKTNCALDKKLVDKGFDSFAKLTQRAIQFNGGRLNVVINEESGEPSSFTFNFEMRSDDPRVLKDWLKMDLQELKEVVTRFMQDVWGLRTEGVFV